MNYPLPPVGKHLATLTRVTDLGSRQTKFGSKDMVRLQWKIETGDGHANAFQNLPKSWTSRSRLRRTVEAVKGFPVPYFNLDVLNHLVGQAAWLTIGRERGPWPERRIFAVVERVEHFDTAKPKTKRQRGSLAPERAA